MNPSWKVTVALALGAAIIFFVLYGIHEAALV